jgi:hypothetical protein
MADQPNDLLVLKRWADVIAEEPERIPPVPVLYHYTDPPGLHGILSSNCLWANAAQYSNDLSEVDYAISMANSVMAEIWPLGRATSGQEAFLWNQVSRVFASAFTKPFLVSFCEEGNLLSQWRAYGRRSGFSLAFESLRNEGSIRLKSNNALRVLLRKVLYDPDAQRERLRFLLRKLIELAKELPMPTSPEESRTINAGVTFIAILELTDWACSVKHSAFSEEREWRLIAFPNLTERWFGAELENVEGVMVRATSDLLVPYMELKPPDGEKLPLAGIQCGPGQLQEQSKKAVRILLNKHGYSAIPVTCSEIPLRN